MSGKFHMMRLEMSRNRDQESQPAVPPSVVHELMYVL